MFRVLYAGSISDLSPNFSVVATDHRAHEDAGKAERAAVGWGTHTPVERIALRASEPRGAAPRVARLGCDVEHGSFMMCF